MLGHILAFLLGCLTTAGGLALALFFGLKLGTRKFQKQMAARGQTADILRILEKPPETLGPEEKAMLVEAYPKRLNDRPYERALYPSTKRKPNDPSLPRVRLDREALSLIDPSIGPTFNPVSLASPAGGTDIHASASSAPALLVPSSASTGGFTASPSFAGGLHGATGTSSGGAANNGAGAGKQSSFGNNWQARTGMLYVRVVGVWREMYVVVGRKRLYYCHPPSGSSSKALCVGAVRLDNIDVETKAKTVKKERWGRMEISTQDKKQRLFLGIGLNGERLKYPKGKSGSNHLFFKSKDEVDIFEWRKCILEQTRLPASVEPDDLGDELSEDIHSFGNDQTAADDFSEEDESEFVADQLADDGVTAAAASTSSSLHAIGASSSTNEIPDISGVPLLQRGFIEIKDVDVWTRRFFMIGRRGGECVMSYFKNDKVQNHDEIIGIIKFENEMVVEPIDDEEAARKKERNYLFKIRHPDMRRIFCLSKPNGTKLPSTKDHANDYECYLRVSSDDERKGWLVSIAHAIRNANPNSEVQGVPVIAANQPFEPIPFFRLLMARNWDDMVTSSVFKQNVLEKIKKQIAEIQLPNFIGSIMVSNLSIGSRFVDFDSYRYRTVVLPRTGALEIVIDINLSYAGGLFIELRIEALLKIASKTIVVPLRVMVQLQELTGVISCHVPPSTPKNPAPKWSVFFPETPNFKWKLALTILAPQRGDKSSKEYTLSKFTKVRNFLEAAIEQQICSAMVWPSSMTFHIPFPGRKLGIKLEKITSTVRPAKDGQRRQAPNIEESETVVTMKFIIGRMLDELINNWNQELIPELFVPTCTIYGLNPFYDGPYTGFQGVRDAISELVSAFQDIKLTIVDQAVEGSTIIVRFNLRGVHTGPFWEAQPTGKRILLHGLMTARIRQALVDVLRFYWDPAAIYALL